MALRIAKIFAGHVTNIFVRAPLEENETLPEDEVDVTELTCGMGDAWDGTNFTKVPPSDPTPEHLAAMAQREADLAAKASAKADNVIQYLVTHTPEECAQYVQDNVVDLASARAFLKKVAMALSVLARRDLR